MKAFLVFGRHVLEGPFIAVFGKVGRRENTAYGLPGFRVLPERRLGKLLTDLKLRARGSVGKNNFVNVNRHGQR